MPGPATRLSGSPPAEDAWVKAHHYADKLFDSLEALEEAGGIGAAADSAGWTPKAHKRAEAAVVAARQAIERQLNQLRRRIGCGGHDSGSGR